MYPCVSVASMREEACDKGISFRRNNMSDSLEIEVYWKNFQSESSVQNKTLEMDWFYLEFFLSFFLIHEGKLPSSRTLYICLLVKEELQAKDYPRNHIDESVSWSLRIFIWKDWKKKIIKNISSLLKISSHQSMTVVGSTKTLRL